MRDIATPKQRKVMPTLSRMEPPTGIEPATCSLQVSRTADCATGALIGGYTVPTKKQFYRPSSYKTYNKYYYTTLTRG